ncbi:hypothetical protein D9M71_779360 [compost metagenome]
MLGVNRRGDVDNIAFIKTQVIDDFSPRRLRNRQDDVRAAQMLYFGFVPLPDTFVVQVRVWIDQRNQVVNDGASKD